MSDAVVSTEGSQERELLGHPIGLSICFLTEMWERFSFYGMRAILVLYLTKHFLFNAGEANLIYGAYLGMTYLLPILGGYFADRYLGSRKAVVYGGLLLVLGHISLAFEGPTAQLIDGVVVRNENYLSIFYLSLALIITGVGFLKANISTVVGSLYGPTDPRRDGGFTIFYMGINIGSFLATIIVAGVGEIYGWGYGFGLAGIGMLFGLMTFLWGQHLLEGRADPPNPEMLAEKSSIGLNKEYTIYLIGVGLVGLMWVMLQFQEIVGYMLDGTGIAMLAILLAYGFTKCTKEERERIFVVMILFIFMTVFWMLFEQQGASLTLIADQQIDRDLFGITVTAGQVQTLNPFFIVVLAPVFAMMWTRMGHAGIEPSTPAKFAISLVLIGAGYLVFAWGMALDEGVDKSFIWMVEIYFFLTAAELCLSPVGLSMVTKLSPARIVGMTMGTFFLFIAIGNYKAGWLSSLMGVDGHASGGALDMDKTNQLFINVGALSVGLGILLLLLTPWLKKRMHGVH
ncbi:peptide MFS transporter [Kordiimonas aquimaris]|uniref:peptide MFS transporter n=1 Tax=Kordiimonas aquimaris TaxID=707591 RepID=UPI0021D1FC69|nr:peptide MFS transporter [Kordiimonas aquimaris]